MSFTAEDLKKYLFEGPEDYEAEDYDDRYDEWEEAREEFFYEAGELPGFGTFNSVAQWNLGDGHEQGIVVRHEESGRLFKITGWYSSWDTGEWNELEEVEPYEVTKIRYRKINNAN